VRRILAGLGFIHCDSDLRRELRRVSPAVVPTISVIIGVSLLKEIPGAEQWVGLGFVTIGLLAAILLPGSLGRIASL
jgi:uncharacterized membrane protein